MGSTFLFDHLGKLPEASDCFYSVDQVGTDGATYRIFLYRLASYSDWLHPGAMESRGIMYRQTSEGWELVCRPMQKFHNWKENPFTLDVDLTSIKYATVKEDGSLISSYTDANGELRLKSKGSIQSEQAVAALKWIQSPVAAALHTIVETLDATGWTVNMEWTSPLNRIVISYAIDKLIVLNIRHRLTGVYMEREAVEAMIPAEYLVEISNLMVEDVAAALGTEGLVAFFGNGAPVEFMKVKADAYKVLHRLKDGVNQPNALFEAIIHEQIDDLRASFAEDPAVQLMISTMEELVAAPYNHFVAVTELMHQKYKHLGKKDYVIAVQSELKANLATEAAAALVVCINKYLERDLKMIKSFVYSAQDRIVSQYKVLVVERLNAIGASVSNMEIHQ